MLSKNNDYYPSMAGVCAVKRGAPTHPKVYDLASRMNIPHALAVGYLELLWHFTARYAPQGDVGRHSDDSIAKACLYQGVASRLVSALCAAGWLEVSPRYRLVVHDWHDHADDVTKKHLSRKNLPFLSYTEELTGHSPDNQQSTLGHGPDSDRISAASRAPVPKPSHSHSHSHSHIDTWTEKLCSLHPSPSDPRYPATFCSDHWHRLGEDIVAFDEYMTTVYEGLAAHCTHWALDGNRFALSLDKWLAGGGWKKEPPRIVSNSVPRKKTVMELAEEMERKKNGN